MGKLICAMFVVAAMLAACSSDEDGIRRGSWDGRVFSNEYTGLTFTLPTGWLVTSDAEIAALFGWATEQIPAEGGFWELAEQQMMHDMMVSNPFTGANVQIVFESVHLGIGAYEYVLLAGQSVHLFGGTDFNRDFAPVRIGSYYWHKYQATLEMFGLVQFNTTLVNVYDNVARVIIITTSEGSETVEEIMAAFS